MSHSHSSPLLQVPSVQLLSHLMRWVARQGERPPPNLLAVWALQLTSTITSVLQALNTLQQEGQRRDAGALKHKESACGGKGTGGRIGPSGCRYTNGEDEPGKKIAPNTRTMKPDSSPKRTEAQRKEAIQSFAHEDVSYSAFRQDDPNFPRGQNGAHEPRAFEDPDGQTGSDAHDDEDVNARLKHERDSEYSSPWLEVTHEGAHPKDGVKDNAKHGEESQSEHHHCPQYQHHHHHNNARDNDAFDVSHSAGTNDVSVKSARLGRSDD